MILKQRHNFDFNENFNNTSLHELLILENFYDYKELSLIVDFIFNNQLLNQNDYLFLAGFYFRHGKLEKFNEIIETKLSNQLDKRLDKKILYLKMMFLANLNLQIIAQNYITLL